MADASKVNYLDTEDTPDGVDPVASAMEQQYGSRTGNVVLRGGVWVRKIEQLLIFIYLVVAALLLFRFVLSLFGANKEAIFVNFVYQLTTPFMFAFEGMFGHQPQVGTYILEFEVLVALLVYALVFVGLSRLVRIIFR